MAKLFAAETVSTGPHARGALPRFSLVVSSAGANGWHPAVVLREGATPDFFVRSLAVSRPFVIARPTRSNRLSDAAFRQNELSPAHTSPARRLVVSWAWERRDDGIDQLRFYVKCKGPVLFWSRRKLVMKLRLKEQASPHRRIKIYVGSESIEWRGGPEQALMPAHAAPPVEW